jgi:ribosomal protein L11
MPADKETIDILVDGGKASPGPAIAPKLAIMKLPIQEIFKQINDKTKEYSGMKVPVKLIIDKKTKAFEIEVGTPPVSSLIKKELGIEKAKTVGDEKKESTVTAPAPKEETKKQEKYEVKKIAMKEEGKKEEEKEEEKVKEEGVAAAEQAKPAEEIVLGSLSMQQCIKIANMKMEKMLAKDLKAAVKEVVGTCKSMHGIQVEGKNPKDIIKEIDEGKYDALLK